MKFNMEVDPASSPDTIGEYLREKFFIDDPLSHAVVQRGCYHTFKTNPRAVKLKDMPVLDYSGKAFLVRIGVWTRYNMYVGNVHIEMRYFWDGDGVLEFVLPDGSYLSNTDCKHDSGWEYYAKNGERLS